MLNQNLDTTQGLSVSHFDTKTGKSLDLQDTFSNTVAQYLFPDTTFSLGVVYEQTTPEELQRFPDKSLQFANGNKFYFADAPVRDELFPTASDGAAYGSLPFTSCLNFTEVDHIRVLIIDDKTGENNIGIPPEEAIKLVGDCWGRIDPELHAQIGGQDNTPFQFRMGIRPQPDSPVARIAKGTLAPTDLMSLGLNYDVVLATSAFKGRKGQEQGAIAPGEYNLTLGIGIKSHAYYGTHSLGPQVLVNYPQGVRADILPRQHQELDELEALVQDPVALVQDYLKSTQERYKHRVLSDLELGINDLDPQGLDALMELVEENNSEAIYQILQQDSHYQLLEHSRVAKALNDHLQTRYRELATGRFVKFKGALLQPHADLQEREFCDPTLPDGEKLIVTRSPLIHSNGVITLTNRHLEDVTALQGVAWMNPDTAANYLQADFDGDRVAYTLAREYPTFTEEIEQKHQEPYRYQDVEKKDKIPYTGSFEEIALSAQNNHIGRIAYQVMGAIALEQEAAALPEAEQEAYLVNFSNYFANLERTDHQTGETSLPSPLQGEEEFVQELASLAESAQTTPQKLERVRQLMHNVVNDLANELQVAVDGPKSARRPNEDLISRCRLLTSFEKVGWLSAYKAPETYSKQPLTSTNYSPIDLMAQSVNRLWQDYSLSPRPTHQFQGLFSQENPDLQDLEWAEQTKAEYNRLNARAFRLKEEYTEAPGPRLTLTTAKGNSLTVIHALESNHPKTYDLEKMDIRIYKNQGKNAHPERRYVVTASVPGEVNEQGKPLYKRVGYLSSISEREQGREIEKLLANSTNNRLDLQGVSIEVSPGVTPNQIQTAFGQAKDFAQGTYDQIPAHEKLKKAAALWQVTHRRQKRLANQQGETKPEHEQKQRYNKASAAFTIFSEEIASQLSQLQFTEFKLTGVSTPANEYGNPPPDQKPFLIDLETSPRHPYYGVRSLCVEGRVLGYFGIDEPQLPIGATGQVSFQTELGKTLTATLPNGDSFRVGVLKNYGYAQTPFNKTPAELQVTWVTPKGRYKPLPALQYQGEILGEVRDKDAIATLRSHQLQTEGSKFSATLDRQSNQTVVGASVDPNTVEYGERFLTHKALIPNLETLPYRESLWTKVDYKWSTVSGQFQEKPTFQFASDHRLLQPIQTFLSEKQIPYEIATDFGDVGREYELGFTVLRVEEEKMTPEVKQSLIKKLGTPLSWDEYQQRLAKIETSKETSISNVPLSPSQGKFSPQLPSLPEVTITGKPIAMNYALQWGSESNPLPVTTTIEAMRGHGRTHTTRGYEPYKAYGFKEGDLALAVSKKQQVLFKVGKQYLISPAMANDPSYQAQWSNSEKHSASYLTKLVNQYRELWGLEMSPIGDYRNGQVYEFHSDRLIQLNTLSQRQPEQSEKQTESISSVSSKDLFKPTLDQDKALKQLHEWITNPNQATPESNQFLLKGYAGTGKSLTIVQFLQQVKQVNPKLSIAYVGPTHEAVNVGRQLCQQVGMELEQVSTLQSLLKYKKTYDNVTNQSVFKAAKITPKLLAEIPDLVVVDEASMVNREMFGAFTELAKQGKRILYVGDDAQIRPVNEARSLVFGDPSIQHRANLTEVVRYSNELAYLATALRNEQDVAKSPIVSSFDTSVSALPQEQWLNLILEKFTSPQFEADPNHFQVYAYTNTRVSELNGLIREARYGQNAPQFVHQELLVAKDTCCDIYGDSAFTNAQEIVVLSAKLLDASKDSNQLSCWLLEAKAINGEGDSTLIKVVSKESQQQYLSLLFQKEQDWKQEPSGRRKSQLWWDAEKFKTEYATVDYAYARTYHMAQGKTKCYVAIDEENIVDSFNPRIQRESNIQNKKDLTTQKHELLYVASTRAQKGIFVYNRQAEVNATLGKESPRPWYLPKDYQTESFQQKSQTSPWLPKPDNPYLLVPQHSNPQVEKNRVKDRAMAAEASQFIGFPVNPTLSTSTLAYQEAWGHYGLANTGNYTQDDVIMVSGNISRPRQGISDQAIKTTFEKCYQPLLDRAIATKAQILVGNARGTDQLVQDYLREKNYQLTPTSKNYLEAVPSLRQEESNRGVVDASASPISSFSIEDSGNGNSGNGKGRLSAQEQQRQHTVKVAPILKALLDLEETTSKQGKTFITTWDTSAQLLSLVDAQTHQFKALAQLRNGQWQGVDLPLVDQTQPNLTQKEVQFFTDTIAPQVQAHQQAKDTRYRSWYNSAKDQAVATYQTKNPQQSLSPVQVDLRVALSVLRESPDPSDIKRVLAQSDTALSFKESSTPEEAQTKIQAYTLHLLEQVQNLPQHTPASTIQNER